MTEPPPAFDIFEHVKAGGWYVAPLLLSALLWMTAERNKLLAKLEAKSAKVEDMAERMFTLMAEIKILLSGKGRTR